MGNSLQEQLLKAGLVTEQQVEQAQKPPPRPKRGSKDKDGRGKGPRRKARARPGRAARPDGEQPAAAREAAPPGPLLRPTQNKKTMRRRVRAYLAEHELNTENGSVPYNFLRGTRIKRLYVTEEQRTRLLAGELLIAEVYSTHHILEPPVLPPLLKLLPETFVHRHEPGAESERVEGDAADEADYAGHEVPDDLIW